MGRPIKNLSKCYIWGEYILIFLCVGSREYPFERLLKEVDHLIDIKLIKEPVFAQIGNTVYQPKNYMFKPFLSKDEFESYQRKASIIISHGGTGALISSLKLGKRVIAVPRLEKFKEHTDDHQLQICSVLEHKGYLVSVYNIVDLKHKLHYIKTDFNIKKYDNVSKVIEVIVNFINA